MNTRLDKKNAIKEPDSFDGLQEQLSGAKSFPDYLAIVDASRPFITQTLNAQYSLPAAQLFALKITNLLVARYEYLHRHTRILARPFGLIIDPVNNCNLHCPGCIHSRNEPIRNAGIDWPSGIMSDQTFSVFLRKFVPYAVQVLFYSNGEPFLAGNTPDRVQQARAYAVMTTSSSNLSHPKFDADKIVESGLDYLTMSIDGADEETYLKFRRGGDFELVLQHVRALVKAKKRRHSDRPTLAWQFLVFKHNSHQVDAVKELARSLGADLMIYAKPVSVAWDDPDVADEEAFTNYGVIPLQEPVPPSLRDKIRQRLSRIFHNPSVDLPEIERVVQHADPSLIDTPWKESWTEKFERIGGDPAAGEGTRSVCDWLYKSMSVDALGRIMPCCRAPSRNEALVFGHLNDDDPYNSPFYRQSRHFYAADRNGEKPDDISSTPFCLKCPHPDLGILTGHHHIRLFFERFDSHRILPAPFVDYLTEW